MWRFTDKQGERLLHLPFHASTIQGLAWSPDGVYLASGAADGHVAIWNRRGDLCFHLGRHQRKAHGIRDLAWWRDLLAVADDGGHLMFYQIPHPPSPVPQKLLNRFHLLR